MTVASPQPLPVASFCVLAKFLSRISEKAEAAAQDPLGLCPESTIQICVRTCFPTL